MSDTPRENGEDAPGCGEPCENVRAALEQRNPVACWRGAVHQIRVRISGHIEQIGRIHPHFAPHAPIRNRLSHTVATRIGEEVAHGALAEVVVVAVAL